MKKLNKIKLTALNRNEIADREQRMLKGGVDYKCGCMVICMDELAYALKKVDMNQSIKFTIVMHIAKMVKQELILHMNLFIKKT